MKFGVFDHLDHSGLPFGQHYENRLRLIEAYDRAGIYGYHLAEHHSTPLGIAASPGIFLSAVAQRTRQLRFGPLVYLLPFYHPIRLIEEICMLDQMSGGRLQLGVGRGVSPFETAFYGIDFAQSQQIYHEAYQLVMQGLTTDELTFEGKYYRFQKVPMILKPVQKPHPPLWYGINLPENVVWPAANDVNVVTIGLRPTARAIVDRYHAERARLGKKPESLPLIGVSKHVVVAETDAKARHIAASGLPGLARKLPLAVRAPQHGAAHHRYSAAHIRRTDAAQQRHRRLAADGARLHRCGTRGHGHQLFRLMARLRRSLARGVACDRWNCSAARSCRHLPIGRQRRPSKISAHVLFGKPVSTFPGHALERHHRLVFGVAQRQRRLDVAHMRRSR